MLILAKPFESKKNEVTSNRLIRVRNYSLKLFTFVMRPEMPSCPAHTKRKFQVSNFKVNPSVVSLWWIVKHL